MMMQAQIMRLPAELRERPQWLLAGPNEKGELKVPVSINNAGRPCPGSSTDPHTWLEFEYAAECAEELGYGLGYVLSPADPYTCVDFDVKNHVNAPDKPELWTSAQALQWMQQLVEDLDSYTELSISGQGVHVWCRGDIGSGIKRSGVELYSSARFIACTGKPVHDKPIAERQEELTQLASWMREAAGAARVQGLDDSDDELTDEALMTRAWNADNAEKFRALWSGDWSGMGYPSQSEADLSLMSMLTFYSRSNEQCRRLFRTSGLGAREKALKDDRYLDYTLRLIRGRQAAEDAAAEKVAAQGKALLGRLDEQLARSYAEQLQAQAAATASPAPAPVPLPTLPPSGPPAGVLQGSPGDPGLQWPPGTAGEIAQFIYNSAPRPVKEVAIVAALGWLAGVCGKAWNIPNSGLNLYIILVARSGIGKEAMHSGLGALTYSMRDAIPGANAFVDFSDFASGPALAKACAKQSSFVNVAGEWGRKLKRLAGDGATDGPMQQLRTVMTNLYQKSGPTSIVGGITYSSKDNNVEAVSGVAFSMIGETTPETLYASLTENMMEDGFLSRFTIVEYTGDRPPANAYTVTKPSQELAAHLQALAAQALTLVSRHARTAVSRTGEAGVLMNAFDLECDGEINASEDESWRQMWNRAHLKMCRVAALLAVADNHINPVVDAGHVRWALDLIRRDIGVMRRRLESGDVGTGDGSRAKKLLALIKEFLSTKQLPPSYQIPEAMQRDAVIPRKYLSLRTAQISSFTTHRNGAIAALDAGIRSLCDSGYLAEIDKVKAGELYTFQGRCFRVVQLPGI